MSLNYMLGVGGAVGQNPRPNLVLAISSPLSTKLRSGTVKGHATHFNFFSSS